MWKLLCFMTIVGLVVSENVTAINSNNSSSNDNKTANITNNVIKTEEVVKITPVQKDVNADEGSYANPFDPVNLVALPDDGSLGNFKYYFLILVVSSLSVISIIVFKALRLRKSRAELKYGKASTTDRSETEPLGRSKWLEESSDENEDEIFDINFLKNSRSQNVA